MILFCLCIVISFSSCDTEYSDFTPEVKDMLSQQYGIIITNEVSFVSGIHHSFARDPSLDLVFDVPADIYPTIFKEGWWNENDITVSIENAIGTETLISDSFEGKWITEDPYMATIYATKTSDESFRVEFQGFGLNTRDFDI